MQIKRTEPIKALLFMEALSEKTRREIIKLLIKEGELSLAEIQKKIGKVVSTIYFHLEILVRAGIVNWKHVKKKGRSVKVYYLTNKLFDVEVDLETISEIGKISDLKKYVKELIIKYRKAGKVFPREPKVIDIVKLLNVDAKLAVSIKDYILNFEDDIIDLIAKIYESEIGLIFQDPIKAVELMKVDLYWLLKLIKSKTFSTKL